MRKSLRLCPLLLAVALLFGAGPALAGKRVALVIANSGLSARAVAYEPCQ
ncbi:hypothetical protein ACVWW3_007072 [Bradyrhizobium sp. LM2.9]